MAPQGTHTLLQRPVPPPAAASAAAAASWRPRTVASRWARVSIMLHHHDGLSHLVPVQLQVVVELPPGRRQRQLRVHHRLTEVAVGRLVGQVGGGAAGLQAGRQGRRGRHGPTERPCEHRQHDLSESSREIWQHIHHEGPCPARSLTSRSAISGSPGAGSRFRLACSPRERRSGLVRSATLGCGFENQRACRARVFMCGCGVSDLCMRYCK